MQNCYIVRLPNHQLICFYFQPEKGIVYKQFEQNRWAKEQLLLANTKPHFTITLDKKGIVYLFCQDAIGDIILCNNANGEWTSRVILKNQSNKIYTISLNPMITDDGLCILYNVPNPEEKSNYIVYQKLDENGHWSPAARIDKFFPFTDTLYTVQYISNDHMLLFYLTRNPENNLGYREITPKAQSQYHVFHSTSYQIIDQSFLTTDTCIHVLYVVKSMFSNQLIYRKKETSQFDNPIVIWESQNLDDCLLFFVKDDLYITFISNGQLFYCKSEDKGKTFSKPARYKNKFCLRPTKAIYLSYEKQAVNQFFCRQVYVDSSSIWDVQLIPDLYPDFYPVVSKIPTKPTPPKQPIPATDFETNQSVSPPESIEIRDKLFILQNQIMLLQKQLQEKDNQIMQLSNSLKNRNTEINQIHSNYKLLLQKHQHLQSELAETKIQPPTTQNQIHIPVHNQTQLFYSPSDIDETVSEENIEPPKVDIDKENEAVNQSTDGILENNNSTT